VRKKASATGSDYAAKMPTEFAYGGNVMIPPLFGLAIFHERLAVEKVVPTVRVAEGGFAIHQPLHDVANQRVHRAGLIGNVREQQVEFVRRILQRISEHLVAGSRLDETVRHSRLVATRKEVANVLER